MEQLIFPPFECQLKRSGNKVWIFDILRKKNVVLTPEEWVRQHLVHYLIHHLKYPKALTTLEDALKYNQLQKRSDVVVYTKDGKVFMVIECKSAKVPLTQKSFNQLSVYNQHYKAEYLAITNGLGFYICRMDYEAKSYTFLDEFPSYVKEL